MSSTFVSWALRHGFSDVVNSAGWCDIQVFISTALKHNHVYTVDMLVEIVATDNKNRFELDSNASKIRAVQGHTIKHVNTHELCEQVTLSELENTEVFHVTTKKALKDIQSSRWLLPMKRNCVHFASDLNLLRKFHVNANPVRLLLDVKKWYSSGHLLWRAKNGVLLSTEPVSIEFLQLKKK